jgi:hypothetical protein
MIGISFDEESFVAAAVNIFSCLSPSAKGFENFLHFYLSHIKYGKVLASRHTNPYMQNIACNLYHTTCCRQLLATLASN